MLVSGALAPGIHRRLLRGPLNTTTPCNRLRRTNTGQLPSYSAMNRARIFPRRSEPTDQLHETMPGHGTKITKKKSTTNGGRTTEHTGKGAVDSGTFGYFPIQDQLGFKNYKTDRTPRIKRIAAQRGAEHRLAKNHSSSGQAPALPEVKGPGPISTPCKRVRPGRAPCLPSANSRPLLPPVAFPATGPPPPRRRRCPGVPRPRPGRGPAMSE